MKSRTPVESRRQAPDVSSLFVVLNEDVVLQENISEFFVRGRVVSVPEDDLTTLDFVFVPDNHSLAESGVILANSIVQVNEFLIPVSIMKPEYSQCILRRGTRLGTLERLNISESYCEDVRMISKCKEDHQPSNDPLAELKIGPLPRDEKEKLMEVIKEYSDVFSKSKMDVGCTQLLQHKIDTGDSAPIASAPRRIPTALEEKVDKLVDELLAHDIIRPSESPWNSPIVIVAKKNGDIRLCVDYRRLNSVTKRAVFPIPATQQLLDCLSGSSYFSTLDLSQGYHQVLMDDDDIQKTAFATRRGQFEYKRMPFGLSTAPATFQRLMHIVLRQENWTKCLIYLDDILIFGRDVDEHLSRLRSVLQRIREAGLKLSPSKCFFLQRKVQYLGHIISSKGIQTDPQKIEKVKNWPTPKTVKELKSFLGFCGYYRRFIQNYSEITRPLDTLCCEDAAKDTKDKRKAKEITSKWSPVHEQSFNTLKLALISAPVLSYPKENGEFILDTDASGKGIGAVLSQIQEDQERVVAYASRRLTKAERRYCVTRKELLAVYYFVKYFRHYLFGRPFKVRTDHKALLWMLNWKKPNTSQYCLWKAELEMYDMEVIHRPGIIHTNADALSRLPQCHQCSIKHDNPVTRRHVKIFNSEKSSNNSEVSQDDSNHLVMQMNEDCLKTTNWNIDDDPELGLIVDALKNGGLTKPSMPEKIRAANENVKSLWKQRQHLRIRGDMLYHLDNNKYRLIVPSSLRRQLIKDTHEMIAHGATEKVLSVISPDYYWPRMEEDVLLVIRTCKECQLTKGRWYKEKAPFQSPSIYQPFERIAIDISGPYHQSSHGYKYILAVIDYFSKFPALIPLKRTDSETVSRKLFKHWITIFGAPQVIHSDRGTNFESELFKEQCRILGIRKSKTSPYYPQADGLVERLFRTIKPMVSSVVHSRHVSWCEALPIVEMGLRCAVQSTTRYSPYEVLFGRRMETPLCWKYSNCTNIHKPLENQPSQFTNRYIEDLHRNLEEIHEEVRKNAKLATNRQAKYYNNNKVHPDIQIGDAVLVAVEGHIPNAFPKKLYRGPFRVTGKKFWTFKLEDMETGEVIQRNYNQLKMFHGDTSRIRDLSTRKPLKSHRQSVPINHHSYSSSVQPQYSLAATKIFNQDTTRRYPVRSRERPDRFC